jgi:hypothetical protein
MNNDLSQNSTKNMTNFSQCALLIYFKHIACSYLIITYYYYYYYHHHHHHHHHHRRRRYYYYYDYYYYYYYYYYSYYYCNGTILIYPLETRLNSSSELGL